MTCLWRHLLSQVVELLEIHGFESFPLMLQSVLLIVGESWSGTTLVGKGALHPSQQCCSWNSEIFRCTACRQSEANSSRNCLVVNFRRCFSTLKGSEYGKCRLEWQVIEAQKVGIKWKEERVMSQLFVDVLKLYFCATVFALIFAVIQKFQDQYCLLGY